MNRLILFIFISLLPFYTSADDKFKGASMLQVKPYFSLGIKISGCIYDIRINDVSIMDDQNGYPVSVDMPVNEWITPGSNTISISMQPLEDEEKLAASAQGTITLNVRQSGTPAETNLPISKLSFSNNGADNNSKLYGTTAYGKYDSKKSFISTENGDVSIQKATITEDLNGLVASQEIELKSSLPKWAWIDSEEIQNNEETKKQLIKEYQKIWTALNTKDVKGKIVPQFIERTKELALAYYVDESQMAPTDLEKSPFNEELELPPMYEDHAKLIVFANGKLAKLLRWNDEAMIIFGHKEKDIMTTYDITFRKQNGKWIITR